MENNIISFKGKKIETMTRDELIEALNILSNQYQELLEQHKKDLDILSM